MVNVLKSNGAQAISVNGERMLPMSSLVCAGNTVLINGRRYIVPFEILAIGDGGWMYDALVSSRIYADLSGEGAGMEIIKEEEVDVNKYIISPSVMN